MEERRSNLDNSPQEFYTLTTGETIQLAPDIYSIENDRTVLRISRIGAHTFVKPCATVEHAQSAADEIRHYLETRFDLDYFQIGTRYLSVSHIESVERDGVEISIWFKGNTKTKLAFNMSTEDDAVGMVHELAEEISRYRVVLTNREDFSSTQTYIDNLIGKNTLLRFERRVTEMEEAFGEQPARGEWNREALNYFLAEDAITPRMFYELHGAYWARMKREPGPARNMHFLGLYRRLMASTPIDDRLYRFVLDEIIREGKPRKPVAPL